MQHNRTPRRSRDLISERGARLRSSGLIRMHHGLWVAHGTEPADALVRIAAIHTLYPKAVITGWLAAVGHGHQFPPRIFPDEFASGSARVERPGMLARQYEIPARHTQSITTRAGSSGRIASPAWALFDIARHGDLIEAVCAVDAAPTMGIDPERDLRPLAQSVVRLRGKRQVLRAIGMSDTGSESPWETRTRLYLVEWGFTGFRTQVEVRELGYRLDLARSECKVAVEYDGAHHREARQHAADIRRWNRLRAHGWIVITVTARMLLRAPEEIAAQISCALRERGAAH